MRKNILLDPLRCRGAGIVFSAVLMVSASAAGDADSAQERYGELVRQKDATAIANGLIDVYATESAGKEIDAAGELLGQSAEVGAAVLDILSRGSEANCDAIGAQLLVWMARGDETPRWKRRDREVEPVLMATDEVGRRAAELLDHGDPFVRGLAEWAIAIRIGMENAGPLAVWPMEEAPGWYDKWIETLDGEFLLESDYARQGAVLGVHRSNAAIAKSAAEIRRRTRAMAAAVRDRMDSKTTRRLERQLERFEAVYSRLVKAGDSGNDDPARQRRLWMKLRLAGRRVALMNPDLDFGHILLATRHAYHDGPNITAGAKPYIIKPGGDLLVKSGFGPGDATRPLIDGKLAPGHMRGMELWWDADRIVFSYAAQPRYFEEQLVESDQGFDDKMHGASEPAHIYEIRISGDGLRQITDHPFNSDVEPAYLPNGDIIFCSDRANYGSQCSGSFLQNKKIVNLYRVRADGTGIRAFHNNKDFDRYPHVLDNGLIVYTRWEYQERHLYQTHNVWTTRPDGTMTDALYKEHIDSGPMALRDPRQVPGSHKLVAIACGHHEYAQGAVTVIDHHIGVNEHEGMRIVTPRISPREGSIGRGRTVAEGGIEDRGGLYQQPYALSDRSFLVSYSYHLPRSASNATNFGVYYIDVWGNKELIHREPVLSSVYPMALRKRPRPPIIRDGIEKDKGKAQCYVNDVYRGLDGVERGTVKYIRIAHRTEQPTMHTGDGVTEFNHLHYVPDGSWARVLGVWTWTPARVIGIVPVEEDGSAYFDVPANVPLYFQALDENYMASMGGESQRPACAGLRDGKRGESGRTCGQTRRSSAKLVRAAVQSGGGVWRDDRLE